MISKICVRIYKKVIVTIRKYPTRVNIKFKSQDGEIALEHIKSLDKLRIVKKIGELEKKTIKEIKKKLQEIYKSIVYNNFCYG